MVRIAVHVEGFTEQRFIKNVLADYLYEFDIAITPIIVATSRENTGKKHKGGLTDGAYKSKIRKEILNLLNSYDYVTTLYDFYGLPHDFPGFDKSAANSDTQINNICNGLSEDINNRRFTPFLMKHEFETLLYVEPQAAKTIDINLANGLEEILSNFNNLPENINNNRETSPSHRIKSLYPKYDKVQHGNIIASEIGITKMLEMCPNFATWIGKISSVGKEVV